MKIELTQIESETLGEAIAETIARYIKNANSKIVGAYLLECAETLEGIAEKIKKAQ